MPEKTANYKLNQWKKEDDFLMRDFNADNAALETALTGLKSTVDSKAAQSEVDTLKTTVSAKANQSDLTSLTSTVNTKASQSALNSLTSTVNTKASQSELNTLKNTVNSVSATANSKTRIVTGYYAGNSAETRDFNLGGQPKAVLVMEEAGGTNVNTAIYGGLALVSRPAGDSGDTPPAVEITSTGFRVHQGGRKSRANETYSTYHYIAFF